MTWDRADDAFNDERYGTPGELQGEINVLIKELLSRGCPRERIDALEPEVPGGPSAATAHHRLMIFKSRLRSLLKSYA